MDYEIVFKLELQLMVGQPYQFGEQEFGVGYWYKTALSRTRDAAAPAFPQREHSNVKNIS